jgi:hypothetical protein
VQPALRPLQSLPAQPQNQDLQNCYETLSNLFPYISQIRLFCGGALTAVICLPCYNPACIASEASVVQHWSSSCCSALSSGVIFQGPCRRLVANPSPYRRPDLALIAGDLYEPAPPSNLFRSQNCLMRSSCIALGLVGKGLLVRSPWDRHVSTKRAFTRPCAMHLSAIGLAAVRTSELKMMCNWPHR